MKDNDEIGWALLAVIVICGAVAIGALLGWMVGP